MKPIKNQKPHKKTICKILKHISLLILDDHYFLVDVSPYRHRYIAVQIFFRLDELPFEISLGSVNKMYKYSNFKRKYLDLLLNELKSPIQITNNPMYSTKNKLFYGTFCKRISLVISINFYK